MQETGPGLDGEFKCSTNKGKLANKTLREEVLGVSMEDSTGSVSAIVSKVVIHTNISGGEITKEQTFLCHLSTGLTRRLSALTSTSSL